jgi:hypothetical protein
MKKPIIYTLMILCLGSMLFFGFKAYGKAKAYEESAASLSRNLNIEKLAELQLKELAETFSFGMYENEVKREFNRLEREKRAYAKESQKYFLYYLLTFFVLLGSYFFVSLRAFTFFVSLGTAATLLFGLTTPLLMVTIYKKIEYLGEVVLSYESKGVLGSIMKLFDNGDLVVPIAILLFSVLIPLLKVLTIMFVSLFMKSRFAHGMVKVFKVMGKWSMADVFVVALFLVYFTTDTGVVSHAEIEVGLYFFLLYVIVSMFLTVSADKMLQRVYP